VDRERKKTQKEIWNYLCCLNSDRCETADTRTQPNHETAGRGKKTRSAVYLMGIRTLLRGSLARRNRDHRGLRRGKTFKGIQSMQSVIKSETLEKNRCSAPKSLKFGGPELGQNGSWSRIAPRHGLRSSGGASAVLETRTVRKWKGLCIYQEFTGKENAVN